MLIGLVGKSGAGKDTVFEMLNEIQSEREFVNIKFAQPIKEGLSAIFDLPIVFFEDTYMKETVITHGLTPRFFMESLGKWGRDIDESFWVMLALHKLRYNKDKSHCFTDVRHLNEAKAIKDRGGILIRVNRIKEGQAKLHSEKDISKIDCDYIIDNSGSFFETRKQVIKLWKQIKC